MIGHAGVSKRIEMKMNIELKVKKLHPEAILPKFALPGDAGVDLFAVEETTIEPGQPASLKTGISMEIPNGYVGLIWDKSGLSHKHHLKTVGGVVDSGFRGEIQIGLINLGKKCYIIEKGDKIAQMVIQKFERPKIVETVELSPSKRGDSIFGSTGR